MGFVLYSPQKDRPYLETIMGNRGTTPSWDGEQIAKYGLFGHLEMVGRSLRTERARRNAKLVDENIDRVLIVLADSSEETRQRVSLAIPDVLTVLSMPKDTVMKTWQERLASEMYEDWFRRTKKMGPMLKFSLLGNNERKTFFVVIEAIVKACST